MEDTEALAAAQTTELRRELRAELRALAQGEALAAQAAARRAASVDALERTRRALELEAAQLKMEHLTQAGARARALARPRHPLRMSLRARAFGREAVSAGVFG